MKKISTIAAIMATPFLANAQGTESPINYMETIRICSSIFALGIFMVFILAVLKQILDHRIKNKIVENGVPENIISSLLSTNSNEDKNVNIKWFSILMGFGAGLTIVYYTLPLGIHSLAIMAFCIAVSFLGYYFFLKQTGK